LLGFSATARLLAHGDVLGEGPGPPAEYLVAGLRTLERLADRLDRSSKVTPYSGVFWLPEAVVQAHQVRGTFHFVPVEWVDRRRVHLDQDFIVRSGGLAMSSYLRTSGEP